MVSLWLLWLVTEGLCHCCLVKICAGPCFLFLKSARSRSMARTPSLGYSATSWTASAHPTSVEIHCCDASRKRPAQRSGRGVILQELGVRPAHLDLAGQRRLCYSRHPGEPYFSHPSVWKRKSCITSFVHLSGDPRNWGILDTVLAAGLIVLSTTNVFLENMFTCFCTVKWCACLLHSCF